MRELFSILKKPVFAFYFKELEIFMACLMLNYYNSVAEHEMIFQKFMAI